MGALAAIARRRPTCDAAATDVLVVGEVLVELSSPTPLDGPGTVRLSFSGDALNAAAAAANAGARTALLTRVGDDELGTALLRHAERLGIDVSLVRRVPEPNGVYFVVADVQGDREFVYVRRGSAGSTLVPADVEAAGVDRYGAVVLTGITQAISDVASAAALRAAELAVGAVVYDPNYRRRLTTPERARAALRAVAPLAAVVTPSCPGDARPLLGTGDPDTAAAAIRALGARAAAVTCGPGGVVLDDGTRIPAGEPPALVDATGAGDVFTGTIAARLALGDTLTAAAREAAAAAACSLGGQGGTGYLTQRTEAAR
jgi:2-dehydro-3-deoxygluconokinase